MSGHVVSIVGIGARFSAYPSDAGFGNRAGQGRGEVKVQKLVSERASVGRVGC